LRRMHKLPAAITAYDQGFAYEGEKEFAIPDSYNRVQRLVVRIIDNKNELREPNDLEMIVVPEQKTVLDALRQKSTVFEQLREAKEAIHEMLHVTKTAEGDLWREADLALVRLLLGDRDDIPIEELWSAIPPESESVFKSTRKVAD